MERRPIFIGGLDRSGKTLMRLSLSSHPNIVMTRRTYMWTRFYRRYGDLRHPANFERCLTAMLIHRPMRVLKPDSDRIRREFWHGEPTYARLFALFHQHYAERMGRPRWGDQLGFVERYADAILAAYPTARIIHMIRDPRDRYGDSRSPARPRLRMSSGKVGEDTARWLCSVALAKRNEHQYPGRYKIVHYEPFMARREESLRGVCAFINEDFVPAMLTLDGAIGFGESGGDGRPGLDKVMAAARTAASPAISTSEKAFIQAYAGRAMAAQGYLLEPIRWSVGQRLVFCFADWPLSLARMVAWRAFDARRPV